VLYKIVVNNTIISDINIFQIFNIFNILDSRPGLCSLNLKSVKLILKTYILIEEENSSKSRLSIGTNINMVLCCTSGGAGIVSDTV
jgi:hypothetical protein